MKLVIFAAFNLKNIVKKKKNASLLKTFFCYVITPLELVLVTDTHIVGGSRMNLKGTTRGITIGGSQLRIFIFFINSVSLGL